MDRPTNQPPPVSIGAPFPSVERLVEEPRKNLVRDSRVQVETFVASRVELRQSSSRGVISDLGLVWWMNKTQIEPNQQNYMELL